MIFQSKSRVLLFLSQFSNLGARTKYLELYDVLFCDDTYKTALSEFFVDLIDFLLKKCILEPTGWTICKVLPYRMNNEKLIFWCH